MKINYGSVATTSKRNDIAIEQLVEAYREREFDSE